MTQPDPATPDPAARAAEENRRRLQSLLVQYYNGHLSTDAILIAVDGFIAEAMTYTYSEYCRMQKELAELKMSYYERGVIIGTLNDDLATARAEVESAREPSRLLQARAQGSPR